jgi:hypothetical protein
MNEHHSVTLQLAPSTTDHHHATQAQMQVAAQQLAAHQVINMAHQQSDVDTQIQHQPHMSNPRHLGGDIRVPQVTIHHFSSKIYSQVRVFFFCVFFCLLLFCCVAENDEFCLAQTRRSWTPEEDKKLIELVNAEGGNCWSQIAMHLEGRVGKQCRERWRNHLDPIIRRDSFTAEEDERIMELVQELGTRWSKIAQRLSGRTENSVKNRYHCFLKNRDNNNGSKRSRDDKSGADLKRHMLADKYMLSSMFGEEMGIGKASPEGNFSCNLLGCGKTFPHLSDLLAHRLTHFTEGRYPSTQTSTPMSPTEHVPMHGTIDGLVDDLISRQQPVRRLSYPDEDVKNPHSVDKTPHSSHHLQLSSNILTHHHDYDAADHHAELVHSHLMAENLQRHTTEGLLECTQILKTEGQNKA